LGPLHSGQQLKAVNQVYTVSGVSPGTSSSDLSGASYITRIFTDTPDAGQYDKVYLDFPYNGMSYRPYVAATNTLSKMAESVSLRGSGWSFASGTLSLSQQLGDSCYAGQTGTSVPNCSGTSTTGRFFTVHSKF